MRIVVFGLSVSSSWGNGHATVWRSLITALDADGHEVVFFERDVLCFRAHRDLVELPGRSRLRLYDAWDDVAAEAARACALADAAIVTSYCPDARDAARVVLGAQGAVRCYYDLDTPVTLHHLAHGDDVPYLPEGGLADFDLVLSFTGGPALDELHDRLGATRVACLYASVDPDRHHPTAADPSWVGACSYLGAWSADRQAALDALFLEPARRRPYPFVLAGARYPQTEWPSNVVRVEHVPPPRHASFYASSPVTLSVTRSVRARMGWCPSVRLFEAGACGVPVLSDDWDGLDTFFTHGDDILIATTTEDALAAIERPRAELVRIGRRARERTLAEHSGRRRARELVTLIEAS